MSRSLRSRTRQLVERLAHAIDGSLEDRRRQEHGVDLAVASLFGRVQGPETLADPLAFVDLLRSAIEPLSVKVHAVHSQGGAADPAGRRFAALLDALSASVPPLPGDLALDLAHAADELRTRSEPVETLHMATDAAHHFAISSSFGRKGRVLGAIVRFTHSRRALELGTAYGMSSMFILESMRRWSGDGHLTTVELGSTQFALSSALLTRRYGDRVNCVQGRIPDALPGALRGLDKLDFVFHDAEHTGAAYVRDFEALRPSLAPGSVVVFDDIRWDDRRFVDEPSHTHEGWLRAAGHASVRHAVEVDDSLGLLLLR